MTPELSPSASPKSQLTHPSGLQQRRYQLPESAGFELVLDLRAATTLISRPPRNSPSPPGQNNANAPPVAASFASTATAVRKSPLQSRQLAETAQDPPLYGLHPQASKSQIEMISVPVPEASSFLFLEDCRSQNVSLRPLGKASYVDSICS